MGARERFFPECGAGGFTRVDGTVEFYTRINALLRPDMHVVDYGAGRGQSSEDPAQYRRNLAKLKGKVNRVTGVDVDPIVQTNPLVDEAIVIDSTGNVPLADSSVDLIVTDSTLEHVADPRFVADEFFRMLKPGGWVCARTPNRWGYIGLATNIVPNRFHVAILRHSQPHRKEKDVFPTTYKVNTRRAISKAFSPTRFDHYVYTMNSEPAYFGDSTILWGLMLGVFRLLPESLGAMYFIFLQKKGLAE